MNGYRCYNQRQSAPHTLLHQPIGILQNHLYAAHNNTWNIRQHKRYLIYITITMFFLEEGMQSVACTLIIQCLSTLQIACCTIYPLSVFGITVYTFSFISILLPTFLLYGQNFFISFNSLFRSFHPVKMFYNLFL